MHRIVLLMFLAVVGGCATTPKSLPSDITLASALTQVRDGIAILGAPTEGKKAGLMVSEVNVTFNVAAEVGEEKELKVDLSPGNVIKEIPSGSFSSSSTYEEGRGNQITFKFQNVMFANKDTILGLTSTPSVLTLETTTTEEKGKTVTTEKRPIIAQPMTLEDLLNKLDATFIIQKIDK